MPLLDRLLLLIDADGSKATAELNRVGKATKETLTVGQQFGRDFFKGLGLGAGAFSGVAAANALKQIASATIEAAQAAEADIRSQIILRKTLEATTGASGDQVQSVEDFIQKTSQSVGILDDELRPAFDTLVRSTNDAATAQRLLNLSLDVSAGTGRDVQTVATGVAKAYEGQTTALARLVPEVAGLVREGASTEEVFNQLNRTFGGTAEEVARQAGGFERLKVTVDNMAESYGQNFTPAVNEAAAAAGELYKVQLSLTSAFGKAIASQGGGQLQKALDSRVTTQDLKFLEGQLDRVADYTTHSAKLIVAHQFVNPALNVSLQLKVPFNSLTNDYQIVFNTSWFF